MRNNTKGPPKSVGKALKRTGKTVISLENILSNQDGHRQPVYIPIPFDFSPHGRFAQQTAFFVQMLLQRTAATPERRHFGHFIPIHSNELRNLIGSNYQRVKQQLIDNGIVEVNKRVLDGRWIESYSTGLDKTPAFPKGYRLADRFRTGAVKLFELKQRYRKKLAKYSEIDADLHEWDRWHLHWLRSLNVDNPQSDKLDYWSAFTASNFLNGRHFFRVCRFGRRHTLLTQLSRSMRKFLTWITGEGNSIVDVSACQPLILGYLTATGNGSISVDRLQPINRSQLRTDVATWIDLCECREIYSYLQEQVRESDLPLSITRWSESRRIHFEIDFSRMSERGFKKSVLIPLFDRTIEMERSPVFQVMVRDFPTITEYLRRIKKQDYKKSARLCQCLESHLMQQGVMNDLYLNHPEIPAATIHDAVLTTSVQAPNAADSIRSHFRRLGLNPSIKEEQVSQRQRTRGSPGQTRQLLICCTNFCDRLVSGLGIYARLTGRVRMEWDNIKWWLPDAGTPDSRVTQLTWS